MPVLAGTLRTAARGPRPDSASAPRDPKPARALWPVPMSVAVPRAGSSTSTVPSSTLRSVRSRPTLTSKLVPFTTAAMKGVCTFTCGRSRFSTSSEVSPQRCSTTVMSGSP